MESQHISPISKRYRAFLTVMMCIAYFLYAFNNYQTGQSISDFQKIYDAPFERISYANTVRSFAYAIGALNGFLINMANKQIIIMVYFVVVGLTQMLVTYLKYVPVLYLDYAINGFVSGALELITNVWTIEMWAEECGPYVQAVHFGGSVSAIITPQIFAPFITGPGSTHESRINIPYLALGAASIAFGLFMGLTYFFQKYVPRKVHSNFRVDVTEGKYTQKFREWNSVFVAELWPSLPKHFIIVLCGFMVSIALTIQWSQFTYIVSYAEKSSLQLSTVTAGYMNTAIAASLLASRAFMIGFAKLSFVTPKRINFVCYVLLLAAEILYLIFTDINVIGVWVADCIYGIGLGPVMAGAFQLAEECCPLTDLMGVLFIFMGGLTTSFTPLILASTMDVNPQTLNYVNIFFIGSAIILVLVIYGVGRRFVRPKEVDKTDVNRNSIVLEVITSTAGSRL
ncbi:unnamed protein product, partial [Medioppia subpectinata]